MLGHVVPPAPPAEDLELGERVVVALADVRYVPAALPGHVGRLSVTDRNLRFSSTAGVARELLHGFPPVGDLLGGGVRLVLPRSLVTAVTTTSSFGIFRVLRVTVAGGREHAFHCGVRGLAPLVALLSPAAR